MSETTTEHVADPYSGEPLRDYLIRVVPHRDTCGTRKLPIGGARAECHCSTEVHHRRLAALRHWHQATRGGSR